MGVYDPYKSQSVQEKNNILLKLWEKFPKVILEQELERLTNIQEDQLEAHLTYLEDKNLIKHELLVNGVNFRITAQGIDHRKKKSQPSGYEKLEF